MFSEAFTSHDYTGSGTKHIFTLKNTSLHRSKTFIAAHPQSSVDKLLPVDNACLGIPLPYQECWHKMQKQTLNFLQPTKTIHYNSCTALFQGGSVTSLARIALNKWLLSSDSELRHKATNSSLFKRSKGDSPLLPLRGWQNGGGGGGGISSNTSSHS